MDGVGIAVQNSRIRNVRQEIGKFTDGRCRNCGGLRSLRSLRPLPLPVSGGGHASAIPTILFMKTQRNNQRVTNTISHPLIIQMSVVIPVSIMQACVRHH